jgi:hypothetical protein
MKPNFVCVPIGKGLRFRKKPARNPGQFSSGADRLYLFQGMGRDRVFYFCGGEIHNFGKCSTVAEVAMFRARQFLSGKDLISMRRRACGAKLMLVA